MSLNAEVMKALTSLNLTIIVAENPTKKLDRYVVLIPLSDGLENYADNKPTLELEEVRLSVYVKELSVPSR